MEVIWMIWPKPCLRRRGKLALVTWTTPQKLVSICPLSLELVGSHFLKSSHEAIAGVIHHDINAAESLFGSGNSFFSLRRRFDVELNCSQLLAIPFAEIGQLLRLAGCGHDPVTSFENGFG